MTARTDKIDRVSALCPSPGPTRRLIFSGPDLVLYRLCNRPSLLIGHRGHRLLESAIILYLECSHRLQYPHREGQTTERFSGVDESSGILGVRETCKQSDYREEDGISTRTVRRRDLARGRAKPKRSILYVVARHM